MKKALLHLLTTGAVTFFIAGSAHASSFVAQNGFGQYGSGFNPCLTASSNNPFATGTQLSSSDYGSGCVGGFSVAVDTAAKTITLNNFQAGNYETGVLDITGITQTSITGLSTISSSGLFDPNFYGDPSTFGGIPTPALSFTADSIRILFSSYGGTTGQFTYGQTGTAVFSYSTGAVPEPATWGMMLAGFGMIGFAARRRQRIKTTVTYA